MGSTKYFKRKSDLAICGILFMLLYLLTFYFFDKINIYLLIFLGVLFLAVTLLTINFEISTYQKFLLLALIFGAIFIVLTPPFRVTDENVHFIRAFAISNGDFIPKSNDNGELIVSLPTSFIEMFKTVGDFTNHFDPNFHYSINSTISGFEFHGYSPTTQNTNSVANGSPLVYLPQVIAILICKILNLPILTSVYLGRFFNLITWGWIVYHGIKITPLSKNVLLILSLTPMILHQSASLSPDAITNGISFLFICYILKLRMVEKIKRKELMILVGFSISLALIKFPYFLLLGLFFIIPREKIGNMKHYLKTILIIFVPGILVFLFWNLITAGALVLNKEGVDPGAQILFIINSPLSYVKVQIFTIMKLFPFYIESSLIGVFGGGKELPELLGIIPIFILILALIDNKSETILNIKNKAIIILLFVSLVLLIFLPLYIQYSPVAFPIIDGVQGRYFIPVITLLVLVFSNIGINHSLKNLEKYTEVLIIWSLFIASLSIVQIYY